MQEILKNKVEEPQPERHDKKQKLEYLAEKLHRIVFKTLKKAGLAPPEQRYTHLFDEELAKASASLSGMFSGIAGGGDEKIN